MSTPIETAAESLALIESDTQPDWDHVVRAKAVLRSLAQHRDDIARALLAADGFDALDEDWVKIAADEAGDLYHPRSPIGRAFRAADVVLALLTGEAS